MFAQGGIEYRRRFVSVELCVRLLELSLQAKNESLQCSAGMAAYHIVFTVLCAHHYPPGGVNSTLGDTMKVNLNASSRGKTALNMTNTIALNDLFTIPSAVKSARFVAKVLEKAGLNGLIEILKDGPAKLQQAYLNIINLVFSAPLPSSVTTNNNNNNNNLYHGEYNNNNADVIDATMLASINATLRLSRSYFLKSNTILSILSTLTEQGALSAVRGKALLTCQLLCAHNTLFLQQLSERRLPNLLLRVLSPVFSALETEPYALPTELSYLIKTALSMVSYLRDTCANSTTVLHQQLHLLLTNPLGVLSNAHTDSAYESPTKGTPGTNLFQSARKPSHQASPGKGTVGCLTFCDECCDYLNR